MDAGTDLARHIFWTCPSARQHWEFLLDRWRWLGTFPEDDLHVWVFGLDLTEIPPNVWVVVKHSLNTGADLLKAQAAFFPAAQELWRFVVSTTYRAIWVERLRRMEYPSLSQDVHTARAKTIIRRSARRFCGSTYQPDMGRTNNCLRRYGRPWMIPSSATTNHLCCTYALSNGAQECYTSSFSMEDPAEIQVQAELDLLLSDSTFRRTPHAFCG